MHNVVLLARLSGGFAMFLSDAPQVSKHIAVLEAIADIENPVVPIRLVLRVPISV